MKSTLRGLLVATLGLAIISGCKEEPPKEIKKPPEPGGPITLRVVMIVEPGADLNNPSTTTGGCRLTQNQVKDLARDLVRFAPSFCPGLRIDWDETVVKLEASCLAVLGFPFPPCFSVCSVPGWPDNCPREMPFLWFDANVVGHPAGGPAGLIQADGYIDDYRTINIYFVGNVRHPTIPGDVRGITVVPTTPFIKDYAVITDGAFGEADAPGNPVTLEDYATLFHEVGCHWLKGSHGGETHPTVPPGECPRNLCISGADFEACFTEFGGKRPLDFLQADVSAVCSEQSGEP